MISNPTQRKNLTHCNRSDEDSRWSIVCGVEWVNARQSTSQAPIHWPKHLQWRSNLLRCDASAIFLWENKERRQLIMSGPSKLLIISSRIYHLTKKICQPCLGMWKATSLLNSKSFPNIQALWLANFFLRELTINSSLRETHLKSEGGRCRIWELCRLLQNKVLIASSPSGNCGSKLLFLVQ